MKMLFNHVVDHLFCHNEIMRNMTGQIGEGKENGKLILKHFSQCGLGVI